MDGRIDNVCCFDHRGVIFLDVCSTTVANPPRKASIFDKLDRVKVSSTSVVNPARKMLAAYAAENEKYLDDDASDRTSCPLKWWRVNRLRFPAVAKVTQRLGHINRTLHADIEKPTLLEKKH